uniref:Uncharacterized protein n=1 Tax=Anopheles merus TaxID=30066 RepID=A0A182VEA0_ANOME
MWQAFAHSMRYPKRDGCVYVALFAIIAVASAQHYQQYQQPQYHHQPEYHQYQPQQSGLDGLDKSGLDSLDYGWFMVILVVLWLVMVRIVVLCTGNCQKSYDGQEL